MTKDEYLEFIKELSKKLENGEAADCSCPKTKCPWHGDCYNCVRIHRINGNHVPNCLQFILKDKIKELAKVA